MHLSDFIGLKLHDIGHEDGRLVFTFANNAKILCRIDQYGFSIKKETSQSKKEKEDYEAEVAEAKASTTKRNKEIIHAKASGTKVPKKKISPRKSVSKKTTSVKKSNPKVKKK